MPTKDRQRALARAKLERQMARRAQDARRRRRLLAGIAAAVGLAVVLGGTIWLVVKFGSDDKDNDKAIAPTCAYTDAANDPATTKDVGKPSTKDVANTGTRNATVQTNLGTMTIALDQAKATCTVNSWTYLASKGFYNNTQCHRMTDSLVQCGDPFSSGLGGPSYQYGVENLPSGLHPAYPKGIVAMARSQNPNSVGSQFFIMFGDSDLPPDYTVVGEVTGGTEVLDKIATIGNDGSLNPSEANPQAPGGGKPNQPVTITNLTIS